MQVNRAILDIIIFGAVLIGHFGILFSGESKNTLLLEASRNAQVIPFSVKSNKKEKLIEKITPKINKALSSKRIENKKTEKSTQEKQRSYSLKKFEEQILVYSEPKFPRSAYRMNLSGEVLLKIEVSGDTGSSVSVELEKPSEYSSFNKSAVKAAREWKFKKHSTNYSLYKRIIYKLEL